MGLTVQMQCDKSKPVVNQGAIELLTRERNPIFFDLVWKRTCPPHSIVSSQFRGAITPPPPHNESFPFTAAGRQQTVKIATTTVAPIGNLRVCLDLFISCLSSSSQFLRHCFLSPQTGRRKRHVCRKFKQTLRLPIRATVVGAILTVCPRLEASLIIFRILIVFISNFFENSIRPSLIHQNVCIY